VKRLMLFCGLVSICTFCCPWEGEAQSLRVLVLDALDGKPQAGVKVESLCAGPPGSQWGKSSLTNDTGIATISYVCNDKQMIEIDALPPNKKEQCGDDVKTNLSDVTSTGFVSNPNAAGGIWCPNRVSKTLKPVPGQVIIFVKKPTWWQSHVAG
jgi:hypothetical protein